MTPSVDASFSPPPAPARLVALTVTSAGCAALGLCGLHPVSAAALALAWTAAALPWRVAQGRRDGVAVSIAAAVALPALALLPGGGWLALAGFTTAGAAAAALIAMRVARPDRRRDDLRHELRDADRERLLLHRHIQRYPVLLESCLELSGAREADQFAAVLVARTRALVPEAVEVLVFLGAGARQACRASADASGRPCPRPPGGDERYVASEARALSRRQGGEVTMLVPLRGDRRQQAATAQVSVDEALRGVLSVRLARSDPGDRLALDLLHALGRLGGLGLAAVDLVDQARSLALHDDLTGLFGQHEFLRRLDEAVAQARRQRRPLGVLMCDLDHLKRYNDRYGHPAGDAVLKAVARILRAHLPAQGIACRYGGEEFAVLLPDGDAARAGDIAERIRGAIARAEPDPTHGERRVTASVGWAVVGADESGRTALARADAACYRAKAAGRDRVAGDPLPADGGAAP